MCNNLLNKHAYIFQENQEEYKNKQIEIHELLNNVLSQQEFNKKFIGLINQDQEIKEESLKCQICYNEEKKSEFLFLDNILHPVCRMCFKAHLFQFINSRRVNAITCPHCET